MVKNASMLCHLFSEVIEWIGPKDIMHVVTDNATNYVAAGRLINQKYENIYWSPCAAHCLNLILKYISSMAHISNLVSCALKIISIVDKKADLQALVVDSFFTGHKLGMSANGRTVSAIILDSMFWDDYFTICEIMGPLIELLKIVDADDKPSLGYVYDGMIRAEDAIKDMFKQNKTAYQPYTDIIN
ncbi:uncharacterized protein [Arachis hypogaea]|uniref:uncharacterized protein n=1 Tax=Arachis hypogaea TaxID=3818 RepID=UPI003B227F93